jgi:ubiquinone/menaquinone biosynthesis C-methylase UbiE
MKEYTGPEADYYDSCFSGLEGDLQFYVEEAEKAGAPVLELGCGTGRILLPIAKAGLNIVGLDRAPTMLALLRQKLAKLNPDVQGRVSLIEGDMRDFVSRSSSFRTARFFTYSQQRHKDRL